MRTTAEAALTVASVASYLALVVVFVSDFLM